MTTLYGIKNCDQVKKARRWLDERQVGYHFHDWRADGLPAEVGQWLDQLGWQALVNRSSTSWRALPEDTRATFGDQALALLVETPTLIKRPLLTFGDELLVGFDAERWQAHLDSHAPRNEKAKP
jgi:Spx/MgsR family transcriptional regulator